MAICSDSFERKSIRKKKGKGSLTISLFPPRRYYHFSSFFYHCFFFFLFFFLFVSFSSSSVFAFFITMPEKTFSPEACCANIYNVNRNGKTIGKGNAGRYSLRSSRSSLFSLSSPSVIVKQTST